MSNVRLSRQHVNKLAGFSAALLIALAGGCGGDDESLKKIETAEQTVSALTTDGTFASINDEYRGKELTKVYDSMKSLADSGPDTVKVAASSIASRAKAGLAALESKKAVAADQELDRHLLDLRAGLNNFTLQKSIAESNTGAGTQDLIKTLQGSLDANKKTAADATKAASKVQSNVDELAKRSKSVAAQSTAKRAEASSIEAGMQGVSATQGLEVLKRAATVRSQADLLEQQAAEIGMQLELAQADLTRARAAVAALDEQSKELEGDIARAKTRLDEERKLADIATKAADTAAAAIKQKFADLTAFRSDPLDKAHSGAVAGSKNAFELANQSAAKAGGDRLSVAGGNTGKITAASMQQNYADALVSQARAQDKIAGTLALIAGATPPLPNAAEFAAAAEAARKSSDEALGEARDAYGKIKESLDGITDDKLKGRLDQTSRLLDALSSKQGISADAAPAPAPAAAAPGSPDSPAAAVEPSPALADIRKAVDAYHDKMRGGDFAGTGELMEFASDEDRGAFDGMVGFAQVALAFDAACQEKFNQPGADFLGPRMGPLLANVKTEIESDKARTSADYNIVVAADGKSAVATAKSPREGETPNTLRLKDGHWWLVMENKMPPQAVAGLNILTPALKSLTEGVKSGKFESADQLKTAISAQFGSLGGGARPPAGGEDDPNK